MKFNDSFYIIRFRFSLVFCKDSEMKGGCFLRRVHLEFSTLFSVNDDTHQNREDPFQ